MKLFSKVKEIVSKTGELHFERWAVIETKWFSWYLHRIHKADQDHLHSHPWHFVSVILKGSYRELVQKSPEEYSNFKLKSPGAVAFTNRRWFHKIECVLKKPVYTMVFVWGGNFEGDKWHYLVGGKAIPFEQYREIKHAAKVMGLTIEEFLKLKQF